MDILYLLTIHHQPERVVKLIDNIIAMHPDMRIAILIHPSTTITLDIVWDNVYLYPNPWDKGHGFNDGLLRKQMELIAWSETIGLTSDLVIPIASNCFFIHPVTREWILEHISQGRSYELIDREKMTGWHWPNFAKSDVLLETCREAGITHWTSSQHEGLILPYRIAVTIQKSYEPISALCTEACPYEEIVLPTLALYLMKRMPVILCTIFWKETLRRVEWTEDGKHHVQYRPDHTATEEDIRTCTTPCLKSVGSGPHASDRRDIL